MDAKAYIDDLHDRYSLFYDTKKDVNILNETINIFAQFNDIQGRTFLTSKDIIDTFEINEICFVKHFDSFDATYLSQFIEFLKKAVLKYVEPKQGHMCSYITGVIITEDHLDDKLKRLIRKFKYSKSYFFTLQGWSEVRLLLINPAKEEIIANKPGRKVIKFYKF